MQSVLRYIFAFILSSIGIAASGQDLYRIKRVSVNDGLSQGDIRCMIQDKNGFLWIGTRDGLNRYDGHKFVNYLPLSNDSTSIAFNQITALALGQHNELWVGSSDGLSLYHPETDRFSNYPFNTSTHASTEILHIFCKNDVLILSTTTGLITFDLHKKAFSSSAANVEFQGFRITQFHSSRDFGTWVATDRGVYYRDTLNNTWKRIPSLTRANYILFDNKGIFFCTPQGLFKFDTTAKKPEQIPLPNKGAGYHMIRSRSGDLWVAANEVIVLDQRDDKSVKKILSHDRDALHTLSENRSRVLYETTDGTVWIGTTGYGLNAFSPSQNYFSYLGEQGDLRLSSNYISGIYTADDNELFIATSRGLNHLNLAQKKASVLLNDQGMNLMFKIAADKSGALWISSASGFYRYRDDTFTKMNFPAWVIADIDEPDEGQLLLTTQFNGIFLFDKAKNESSPLIAKADLPSITYTTHLYAGEILVGSDDGLRIFSHDGKLKTHFRSRPGGLPADVIKNIFEDTQHRLWLCTWGGGLCEFTPGDKSFNTYDRSDGLPNNTVYGILEDRVRNLWFSTNSGLSVFQREKNMFRNFDYLDGLQGDEFNTNAFFKSSSGKMYFGGIDGLSIFDPQTIELAVPPLTVQLLNVAINGLVSPLDPSNKYNEVETDWRSNNVGIEFTAVDFSRPDKVEFQYSMSGEEWFTLSSRRNLDLVNLASGIHEVRLRARREGAAWPDTYTTLHISVRPPLWRRSSVIAAAVGLLLAVTYVGYRTRVRFLKKINIALNTTVQERTREIQAKNDEILAQNEELTSNSELLAEKNELLAKQSETLLDLSRKLEVKVYERTHQIQQLNAELTEQNVQLEQFSFIAAHNFRGPLARIRGLVQLIKRNVIHPDELHKMISYLETSANELDDVIRDMSKILNLKKKGEYLQERVSLKESVESAMSLLKDDIRRKDIRVNLRELNDLPVIGSSAFVQSVFYNLIENAVRYSNTTLPDQFIKITAHQDKNSVLVELSDNGIGFDAELAADKIFKLYQRFNTTNSGRGLGLYLVKTQMEMMGGSVSVTSQVGAGTKFSLVFKRA